MAEQTSPSTSAKRAPLAFLAGALITAAAVIVILIALGRFGACPWNPVCGPLVAEDVAQGRLDTALPAPRADARIEQTFTPRRNGLTEIELLLVRYGDPPAGDETGRFLMDLRDDRGAIVAAQTLFNRDLVHNQTYTLRFPLQRDSAGRRYTLRLWGGDANVISAWGYSADVYDGGELALVAGPGLGSAFGTDAQELRFTTRYVLTLGDTLRAVVAPLGQWPLFLVALLYLPLPGVWLLLLVRPRGWDGATWLGSALALGIAAWPVVWLWLSLVGGRWSGPALWATVAVGWAGAALVEWRRQTTDDGRRITKDGQPATKGERPATDGGQKAIVYALLGVLLLVTLASRFVAVRDQVFPPWVDSSRHALITAVMVETGRAPDGYAPLLPVERFPYHFGFHTLSAGLQLMTGWPLAELLLMLMQLLGGLLPLTVYAAGWMVTRLRSVGLLAAFLVALPFFFPGYYATWGRMTQLTAMLVMPVLLALTWRVGRGWPRVWPLVGLLAAGLFLIHFRVFLFYLPFAALAAVAHWLRYRRWRGLAAAGALGALLVAPRLRDLLAATNPLQTFGQSLPGYNDFPVGYLTTGWERFYLALAAAAGLVVVVGVVRRRRWAAFPLLLLLWVGVLFLLLAGDRLGLPETLVVNLNSMYITLFLPLALLLSIVAGRITNYELRITNEDKYSVVSDQSSAVSDQSSAVSGQRSVVSGRRSVVGGLLSVAVGVALALLVAFGWRQQANILNQQTILALPEDAAALAWMDEHLPDDARVAVNAWQWLGVTWAAGDGGAWLTPLTGREATTPPVDHIYNRDLFAEVRAFNDTASAVEDWGDPAAAAWLAEQEVSHVYVGRRGGYFDPAELSRNPALDLLYQRDGTFVFAVR